MTQYDNCMIAKVTIPQSGACAVTVTYENPDPPPAELGKTWTIDRETAGEFLTAIAGSLQADITTDGSGTISTVSYHP